MSFHIILPSIKTFISVQLFLNDKIEAWNIAAYNFDGEKTAE